MKSSSLAVYKIILIQLTFRIIKFLQKMFCFKQFDALKTFHIFKTSSQNQIMKLFLTKIMYHKLILRRILLLTHLQIILKTMNNQSLNKLNHLL